MDRVYELYLVPVVNKIICFLDELSDEALKKEATSEAKSDTFSSIMKVSTGSGEERYIYI